MADLFSVQISAKCDICETIPDFAEKNTEYLHSALQHSANVKIAECRAEGRGVHFRIHVIGGNFNGAYVPKKPERIIAEFVRRYKQVVARNAEIADLWCVGVKIRKVI